MGVTGAHSKPSGGPVGSQLKFGRPLSSGPAAEKSPSLIFSKGPI